MPRVNGKEYPYTAKGMAAASKAKKKTGGMPGKSKPAAPREKLPGKPLLPQRPSRRRVIPLDGPERPAPKMTPVSKTRISGTATSRSGSIIGGIMPKPPKRRVGGSGMPAFPSAPKKRIGGGKPLFPKKQGR
jgi:hypothetical protein